MKLSAEEVELFGLLLQSTIEFLRETEPLIRSGQLEPGLELMERLKVVEGLRDRRIKLQAVLERISEDEPEELPTLTLKEFRKSCGLTQEDVAERLGTKQSAISIREKMPIARMTVTSVRRFVEACGGELELWAVMPDRRVLLDMGGEK